MAAKLNRPKVKDMCRCGHRASYHLHADLTDLSCDACVHPSVTPLLRCRQFDKVSKPERHLHAVPDPEE